jgi:hypothetical protein
MSSAGCSGSSPLVAPDSLRRTDVFGARRAHNHGNEVGPFVVAAGGEQEALAKGWAPYKRQAARGDYVVEITATREEP